MDRFIARAVIHTQIATMCLKSNMDRFIARAVIHTQIATMCLKSNMDRFIAFNRRSHKEQRKV